MPRPGALEMLVRPCSPNHFLRFSNISSFCISDLIEALHHVIIESVLSEFGS